MTLFTTLDINIRMRTSDTILKKTLGLPQQSLLNILEKEVLMNFSFKGGKWYLLRSENVTSLSKTMPTF